jgi:putative hydrolase of the HAD superfamily
VTKPQVIFLDAVGTLFGVKGSVGEIYGAIASKFGVASDIKLLNRAFSQSFQKSPLMAFPDADKDGIPELEFDWWKAIALSTFEIAGVITQFTNFDDFFTELYRHFATAQPWYLYPDAIPSLEAWQKQGIELGIISNFDTRLYQVLEILDLKQYFLTITISSITGAAKPDAKIFRTALEKHDCSGDRAWYIGDSFKEDYCGAASVGIKSFLLQR